MHRRGVRAFRPTEPARRRAARANLLALLGFIGLAALVPLARPALLAGGAAPLPPALGGAELLLCPCTGVAAWLVWRRIDVGLERKRAALRGWGWLLMLSALWPTAAHDLHSPALGLAVLLLCLAAAIRTALAFRKLRPGATLLLLPYAAWLGVMAIGTIAGF